MPISAQDVRDDMGACLRLRLIHTARLCNESSPLVALASPILRRIAEHLSLTGRIVLSQVCYRLRADLLHLPSLWTSFVIPPFDVFYDWAGELSQRRSPTQVAPSRTWDAVIELLRRVAQLPLDITCTFELSSTPDTRMQQRMEELLSRSTKLVLQPHGLYPAWLRPFMQDPRHAHNGLRDNDLHDRYILVGPNQPEWDLLCSMLRSPAPFLQTVQLSPLSFCRYARGDYLLSVDTFAGQANELRSCFLDCVELPPGGCSAFSNLRLFDYKPYSMTGGYQVLRATQVADILASMPRLEVLGLSMFRFWNDSHSIVNVISRPTTSVSLFLDSAGIQSAEAQHSRPSIPALLSFFADRMVANIALFVNEDHDSPAVIASLPQPLDRPDSMILNLRCVILRVESTDCRTRPPV